MTKFPRLVAVSTACALLATWGAVPAAATAPPTVTKAPAALLATTLLTAAKLAPALPGLHGRQDDGGQMVAYPATSFVSAVETQTANTKFQITLSAYGSSASAASGYTSQTSGSTKLPGVGKRAAVVKYQQALVLKGSQVLLVRVSNTPAGNDLVAAGGKAPAVLDQLLEAPLLTATKALARHMNGKPAKKPYTHLPAGAVNPCAVSDATLKAATHQTVSSARASSETPPAQQCDYEVNSQPFIAETYTHAQAVTASPPTTLDAVFDADLAAHATDPHKTLTATVGPVRLFMVPDKDWTAEALVESSAKGIPASAVDGAAVDGGLGTHGVVLIRVLNGYTYTVDEDDCVNLFNHEIAAVLDETLDKVPTSKSAVSKDLLERVHNFCFDLVEGEDEG